MRNETIAIHAGYEPDPTTKSVAVPIYQTVAYAFDSADHGAALFNLESEGFRYSRIANPTTSVLEKRISELEGGIGALAVATGQAALHFAFVNVADFGGNSALAKVVLPETIRLSIGIEHIADIIEDIDQALAKACARPSLQAAE